MSSRIKNMTEGKPVFLIISFALPLMVGVVCGAYSSVCITGSLWYVMRTKLGGKKKEAERFGKKKK